ncbi:MAG: HpcH/HpaI aldolase/citrate lyase family protein [Pseudomonadota bacterium]
MTSTRAPGSDRLRRSLHFVPGGSDRMLEKSLATDADSLVLDLEDAVTPKRKAEARSRVARWLERVDFGGKERTVRMNPLDTPWGLEDVAATMAHPPDAYVVPKVSTLAELETLDAEISRLESRHGHAPNGVGLILVATETPLGVLNAATFPECRRVIAMTWGAEDLSASLGAPRNRHPDGTFLDVYRHCRVQTLLAAAAGGVQPLDSVFVDIRDTEGLRAECREAAWMGFTGKITIHPDQVETVNAAFTPSAEEVAEAERLVDAMTEAEQRGLMAIDFEGRMVDVPHKHRAQRLLARARQIREKP